MAKELFSRGSERSASFIPPLGIAYIASYLEKFGYECKIIDGVAEPIPLPSVCGISHRYDIIGITVVNTGRRSYIDPLDEIPMPARHLLPVHLYKSSIARFSKQPSHSMLASRGCPGICTFCSKKTFGTKIYHFWMDTISLNWHSHRF